MIYCVLSFVAIMFDEVVPLWALCSRPKGGLSWGSSDIGLALSIVGEAHENVEVVLDCLLDVGTEVADAEDVRCHLALLAPDLAVGGKDAVLAHCKE